jgi:hypothetical protein
MAETLGYSYSKLKDARVELGLALAYEANKAFGISEEADAIIDKVIERCNTETLDMYLTVRNNSLGHFEAFVGAAALLIGVDTSITAKDLAG